MQSISVPGLCTHSGLTSIFLQNTFVHKVNCVHVLLAIIEMERYSAQNRGRKGSCLSLYNKQPLPESALFQRKRFDQLGWSTCTRSLCNSITALLHTALLASCHNPWVRWLLRVAHRLLTHSILPIDIKCLKDLSPCQWFKIKISFESLRTKRCYVW